MVHKKAKQLAANSALVFVNTIRATLGHIKSLSDSNILETSLLAIALLTLGYISLFSFIDAVTLTYYGGQVGIVAQNVRSSVSGFIESIMSYSQKDNVYITNIQNSQPSPSINSIGEFLEYLLLMCIMIPILIAIFYVMSVIIGALVSVVPELYALCAMIPAALYYGIYHFATSAITHARSLFVYRAVQLECTVTSICLVTKLTDMSCSYIHNNINNIEAWANNELEQAKKQ